MNSTPSKSSFWVTFAAVIGGFAIFALIVAIAYLAKRPAPLMQGTKTPDERITILTDLRAKEQKALNNYGWVDQQKGVVQLPLSRATELTIQELNAKK